MAHEGNLADLRCGRRWLCLPRLFASAAVVSMWLLAKAGRVAVTATLLVSAAVLLVAATTLMLAAAGLLRAMMLGGLPVLL